MAKNKTEQSGLRNVTVRKKNDTGLYTATGKLKDLSVEGGQELPGTEK